MLRRIRTSLFHHLYHDLAWTYDLVAWVVSLGAWGAWIESSVEHIRGPAVLELGHGTGHLQRVLWGIPGLRPIGMDESAQMGRLARRRAVPPGRLCRGRAEQLPFGPGRFNSLVSTFPSEYVLNPRTLSEASRVLVPRGLLVVVSAAWINVPGFLCRFTARPLRARQRSSPDNSRLVDHLETLMRAAGFLPRSFRHSLGSTTVLVTVAEKL
jgi:ubiquinone/menaquinone biosynthesis C-methylase UbiE